jgi:hypothetical protein
MRAEHAQAIALLKRLDANPDVKTNVILDVMATFAAVFEADRRSEKSFIEEFADSLTRKEE